MNLVTFNEGIQSIRIQQEPSFEQTLPSKSFVPDGDSVVQHTDALFLNPTSSKALLFQLMKDGDQGSADPAQFDTFVDQTIQHLSSLMVNPMYCSDLVKPAVEVLHKLAEDRAELQRNLSALERV